MLSKEQAVKARQDFVKLDRWEPQQVFVVRDLVCCGLISDVIIFRALVLTWYAEEMKGKRGDKKQAIQTVQNRIPLSFRYIESIIKNHSTTYRFKFDKL